MIPLVRERLFQFPSAIGIRGADMELAGKPRGQFNFSTVFHPEAERFEAWSHQMAPLFRTAPLADPLLYQAELDGRGFGERRPEAARRQIQSGAVLLPDFTDGLCQRVRS